MLGNKIEDAIQLLFEGAKNLLKHEQVGSGADLAMRMLHIYDSESIPCDQTSRARIVALLLDYPAKHATFADFVRACCKWSAKVSESPLGDPQLRHIFGAKLYHDKLWYDAEAQLVYGTADSAKLLGKMAFEWAEKNVAKDSGYFVLRHVMELLALSKVRDALLCFDEYWSLLIKAYPELPCNKLHHGQTTVSLVESSMTNFARFIVMCVEKQDTADAFIALRQQYQTLLQVDPYLMKLFEEIAIIYYDLGPKRQPNVLEDLMSSLFGGPMPSQQRKAVRQQPQGPVIEEMD